MDYTICSRAIKAAKGYNKYTSDLLMVFTQTNSYRVVKNSKILDVYGKIADESIRTWINLVTNCGYWKECECDANEKNIFFETCLRVADKKLIADEKEDYTEEERCAINILNKDEAIDELNPGKKVINHINQGDNSNAIIGADSKIKQKI